MTNTEWRTLASRMAGCYLTVATNKDAYIRELFEWELDRIANIVKENAKSLRGWVEYD